MVQRSEALADEIVKLARSGKIPIPFRVGDCKRRIRGYADSHMNTVLANYEIAGDQVRRGRAARFRRVTDVECPSQICVLQRSNELAGRDDVPPLPCHDVKH